MSLPSRDRLGIDGLENLISGEVGRVQGAGRRTRSRDRASPAQSLGHTLWGILPGRGRSWNSVLQRSVGGRAEHLSRLNNSKPCAATRATPVLSATPYITILYGNLIPPGVGPIGQDRPSWPCPACESAQVPPGSTSHWSVSPERADRARALPPGARSHDRAGLYRLVESEGLGGRRIPKVDPVIGADLAYRG